MTDVPEYRMGNSPSQQLIDEAYQRGYEDGQDNNPQVIRYIDTLMPIIIHICSVCHVELFRAMTLENKTIFNSYCLACDPRYKSHHQGDE